MLINTIGLSNREIFQDPCRAPFLPTEEYLLRRSTKINLSSQWLWERIWRGSQPESYSGQEMDVQSFYENYLNTRLVRDIQPAGQIKNIQIFQTFVIALAARTGQLLNLAALTKEIGIDQRTGKKWLRLLEAQGFIYLLQPCDRQTSKRVVRTPKIYFLDTGLVCYLCGWLTAENAQRGAMSTQLFESFTFGEVLKSYTKVKEEPKLSFYRDGNGNEISLLIEKDNTLYPLIMKKLGTPETRDARVLTLLPEIYPKANIAEGGIIANITAPMLIINNIRAIPVTYI